MSQNELLEVEWTSGDISFYDLMLFCSGLPFGNNLLTEVKLELAQVQSPGTEGLWVSFWRYEPINKGSAYGLDAYQTPAARVLILTAEELECVSAIRRGGRAVLFRLGEDLINTEKLNRYSQMYTAPDTLAGGYYEVIADLYDRLEGKARKDICTSKGMLDASLVSNAEIEAKVAALLGIPPELLQRAIGGEGQVSLCLEADEWALETERGDGDEDQATL